MNVHDTIRILERLQVEREWSEALRVALDNLIAASDHIILELAVARVTGLSPVGAVRMKKALAEARTLARTED